jgi:hypothetical protein
MMHQHVRLADFLPQTKTEAITDAAAAAVVASPVWLPWLAEMSKVFALLLPIAGFVWFTVQIVAKIYVTRKILRSLSDQRILPPP